MAAERWTARWRSVRPGLLVQNAIALMISSGGSALLGFVFWVVAARLDSPTRVGRTIAELAAVTLLAALAQLSFGSIFERFLPVAGELTLAFVRRAYATCMIFAVVLSLGYLALGFGRRFIPATLEGRSFFVLAVVVWTIFALQDSVMIGLRASKWVAVENVTYGVVKLVFLPVAVGLSVGQGIFAATIVPIVPTIAIVTWYLLRHRIPAHVALGGSTEALPSTRNLITLAAAQYATLLTIVFLPSIVTFIVIERLGPVANAHYYLPSMMVMSLSFFCSGVARSFLVEASTEPGELRRHANSALRALAAVVIPSVVIGIIFAPELLGLFGHGYATQGTTLMRLLLLSLVGNGIMLYYSAFAWLDRRVWPMTVRNLLIGALYLSIIYVLIGRLGINAVGVASLVDAGLTSVIFLPIVIRRYHATHP